jgi:hypothetical protein
MDGTQATDAVGGHLGAATVIIQDTVVRTSRFLEYGVPPRTSSPPAPARPWCSATDARGGCTGPAEPDSGTTYTLPSGARMTFAPGQVWVVLTTTNWATAGL